ATGRHTRPSSFRAWSEPTSPAPDAQQQIHGRLVGRREAVVLELVRSDPTAIGDAHRLGLFLALDDRLVERQIDGIAVVVVGAAPDAHLDLDLDADALADFTSERGLVGLA